jgi:low affinity Fe/Cu permease
VSAWFDRFASYVAWLTGTAWAFVSAVAVILIWAATGPFAGWSDTWQLVANTGTTIVTFWLVFAIQHTQNRQTAELKALLKEIAEDLPDVDELRAQARVEAEERPS